MVSIWDKKINGNLLVMGEFKAFAPNSEAALKVLPYNSGNSSAVDQFLDKIQSKAIDGKPIEAAFGNKQTVARLNVLAERDTDAFNEILAQAQTNPNNFGNSIDAHYLKDYPTAGNPVAAAPKPPKAATPARPAVASTKPVAKATVPPPAEKGTPPATPDVPPAVPDVPADTDPAATQLKADAAKPKPKDDDASADDGAGDIAQLMKSLPAFMQVLNYLADSNIPILSGLAKAIKGFIGGPTMSGLLGSMGIDVKSLGLTADTKKTTNNATLSNDLANNAARGAYLGNLVNDQEAVKSDSILDKNQQKVGSYQKNPDGSYTATFTTPDGNKERWDKVFQETDPINGGTLMAFERRTADGKVYIGADKKSQVMLFNVGNMGTEQDLAAMQKIVSGTPAPELFASTAQQTEHFYQYEKQVSAARGIDTPDITLFLHSKGNFTSGAITQQLASHGVEPQLTIRDAPFGAGEGLEYLAKQGKTPAESQAIYDQLTKNVVVFQPEGTFESMPGGKMTNANGTPGSLVLGFKGPTPASSVPNTAPGAFPGNLLNSSGHELSALGNTIYQNGMGAFSSLPTPPASAFLNDTALPDSQQNLAETGMTAFASYTHKQHAPTFATSTTNFMAPIGADVLAAAASEAAPAGPLATVKPKNLGESLIAERQRQIQLAAADPINHPLPTNVPGWVPLEAVATTANPPGAVAYTSPGATTPNDVEANKKAIRASYLGSLINDEEAQKADSKLGTHEKLPNGNFTATLTMPDGSKERYDEVIKKTDMVNGTTTTLVVFERRALDGGLYKGPNGQISVIPVKAGGDPTPQDVDLIKAHINRELDKTNNNQPLFETASNVNPEEPRKTAANIVPLFPTGANYNVLKGGAPLLPTNASTAEPSLVAQLELPATGAPAQSAAPVDITNAAAAKAKKFPQPSPFSTPGSSFS